MCFKLSKFTAKVYFWMGYQFFFQSRPVCLIRLSYIIKLTARRWSFDLVSLWSEYYDIPECFLLFFTEASKQVRYCNNIYLIIYYGFTAQVLKVCRTPGPIQPANDIEIRTTWMIHVQRWTWIYLKYNVKEWDTYVA